MNPSTIDLVAGALLAAGVIHTFCVGACRRNARRFAEGTFPHDLLLLLAEVEVVFILWAAVLIAALAAVSGPAQAVEYLEGRPLEEPVFVFVIMVIASTRPIVEAAEHAVNGITGLLPVPSRVGFAAAVLTAGPLLGSFITEPAAMTVSAHLLRHRLLDRSMPRAVLYALTGTLFVNVSIGGTLTHFAAPPVMMVAATFGWSGLDPLRLIGWKAVVAVTLNAGLFALVFWRALVVAAPRGREDPPARRTPGWVTAVHLAFLTFAVLTARHSKTCVGSFILFLGFVTVTREYQSRLPLRSSLLVAGFLAGLVTLGGMQSWWLQPLLASLGPLTLYAAATALTAVTDNAALTYLGSRVPLSPEMRYALVAGAVTGGGLTVIANAPNPVGHAILEPAFGEKGLSAVGLLLGALVPTLVVILCFLSLPSL